MPLRPDKTAIGGREVERLVLSDMPFGLDWLRRELDGLTPDLARFARLDDDGMAPRLPKGAAVLIDLRPTGLRSGIYLVEAGDELLARRLRRLPDGSAELVADNDPAWRFPVPAGDAS